MKVQLTEPVELKGDRWDEKFFNHLKTTNPDGRVAVTDEKGQIFVVSIKHLEISKC